MKILGLMILLIGMSGAAMADCYGDDCPVAVPEISGSLATGALALLSGTIVLVRSRYKK